jgi:hypothetical protein
MYNTCKVFRCMPEDFYCKIPRVSQCSVIDDSPLMCVVSVTLMQRNLTSTQLEILCVLACVLSVCILENKTGY